MYVTVGQTADCDQSCFCPWGSPELRILRLEAYERGLLAESLKRTVSDMLNYADCPFLEVQGRPYLA